MNHNRSAKQMFLVLQFKFVFVNYTKKTNDSYYRYSYDAEFFESTPDGKPSPQ